MLYSRTTGTGPPLVLLHGLFGSLENLGGLSRRLSSHFTLHSLDLPGHGRSDTLPELTLPAMAAAVMEWCEANEIHQAAWLGHSLGGKVAMEVALRFGHAVERLAVLDIAPTVYKNHHDQIFKAMNALDVRALESRDAADAAFAADVPDAAVRSFLLKNLVREGERWQWRLDLAGLSRDYPQLIGENYRAQSRTPCLFLRGDQSHYLPPELPSAALERFPQATMITIRNTGHWLHAEAPDAVAQALLPFLAPP